MTRALACRIGVGLSASDSASTAAQAAAEQARGGPLGSAEVDLALLFVSAAHRGDVSTAADAVREVLGPRHLLGCVAQGVLASGRELEEGPGVAVWAGSLPGAEIAPFHASAVETGAGVGVTGFPEPERPDVVALVADPYTFPIAPLLAALNETHDRVPVVGGLAVAGASPGAQSFVLDDELHPGGAVGVAISGVPVRTIVSQGCAPIGREAVVTSCEGNRVTELAGQPALEFLQSEIEALTLEEQELVSRGLLVGIVIDENRPEYKTGDFLMRGLLGADRAEGSLLLGETVRVGQTVRFFARDALSADADLRRSLDDGLRGERPAGALLFTCNGRGTHMFAEPDHDARVIGEALGTPALAGFFCGGEIGPVGGKAFLHGFTATLAVFLDR